MCIDRIADRMVEKQKLPVDTDRCAILRRANFLLDGFNGIQIFAGIQEHFAGPLRKNSIPIVTRERGKICLTKFAFEDPQQKAAGFQTLPAGSL